MPTYRSSPFLASIALILLSASASTAQARLDLAGAWRFALDPHDQGIKGRWFARDLADRIRLPGSLQEQGYGDEISTATPWVLSLYDRHWYLRAEYRAAAQPGNVRVPFLAQPPRHYLGPAWYQRDLEIPAAWSGKRIALFLERPHWETTVWLDDREIGSCRSLVAPHVYELGQLTTGKHRLTIRIDNRLIMPYRPDAHSVSDSLGGTWNGIVGRIELQATTPVWLDDVQVFPDIEKRSARVKVQIGNITGRAGTGTLTVNGASVPASWGAQGGSAELEITLDQNAQTWDEFNPALQKLTVRLAGDGADDTRQVTFGLRSLRADGTRFLLNGRPIIFRGTHHGGDFPLTGYPPTDVEYWRRLIRLCQSWGLNHMRFHSFCPPEAAFIAADELGFYLQPEAGMWNAISPGTEMERMLYEETERMIRAYGNHPSFMLLSPSNEPSGRWKEALPRWVEHFRREDPRRLYTTGTGWSLIDAPGPVKGADYLAVHRIGPNMLRGPSAWFGLDYSRSLRGVDVPVIVHELGQWSAYPDYDVIKKFTGYLRPGNYEIFRASMAAHGLLAKDKDFAFASGRFQLACYKEEIEANLRTPRLSGFQLLDLHDYLGQGTALVGVLDPFWEQKGYVTAEEFRRFCGPTVPLARLQSRVFTTDDLFAVDVEIAHYGPTPLEKATPYWKIADSDGKIVAQGEWPERTIPIGKNIPLGKIEVELAKFPAPRAYRLIVGLRGTQAENDWDFWVYPARVDTTAPRDILITRSWEEAEMRLAEGGKVLFIPRVADLDWTSPPLDVVPLFWNRQMNPAWSRMLGLWIDERHPAFARFPTRSYFDWQWADLIRGVRAINLDSLPRELEPVVYAIDDWNRNYKLGVIFECRVGRGRLLVSAIDLIDRLAERPAARQLRRSLLDYMASARFQPRVSVAASAIRGLLFDTRIMSKLGATAHADEGDATRAIDGDPNTYWFSSRHPYPHELAIRFPSPVAISGVVIMPRQNHREHEGDIREYLLLASDDGATWHEVKRGELVSTFAPQRIAFAQTITTRHLKLVALSGFADDQTAALAELAVIYAGPPLGENGDGSIRYQRQRPASPDVDEAPDRPMPRRATRP
jgi:beta-galactosidase